LVGRVVAVREGGPGRFADCLAGSRIKSETSRPPVVEGGSCTRRHARTVVERRAPSNGDSGSGRGTLGTAVAVRPRGRLVWIGSRPPATRALDL
jgi:hypothetical protein